MMIRVQYDNYHYDYVNTQMLDRLLAGRSLKQFFRPSEETWVRVDCDPIRGIGGDYSGPDRRQLTW
jgi:hypothetical protein